MFTGIAVSSASSRARSRTTRSSGTYLDGFPADVAGTVTVDQLLTHTSGMEFLGNGAGGAYSTAADLTAFITALTGNKLLDAQHTWLATNPKSPVPPKGPPPAGKPPQFLFACYGPSDMLTNGHWLLGHNGGQQQR